MKIVWINKNSLISNFSFNLTTNFRFIVISNFSQVKFYRLHIEISEQFHTKINFHSTTNSTWVNMINMIDRL